MHTLEDVRSVYNLPFFDLLQRAHQVHREHFNPYEVQLSSIVSIKTGGCPENCKYCPQSAHYQTAVQKEPLWDVEKVRESALKVKDKGVTRYCMGAAWRSLHDRDVDKICELIKEVKGMGMEACVTLGMLTPAQAVRLKEAGLDYYNHNLDTAEEHYGEIISTRTYADRLMTLQAVQDAGINVCCGGILGLGETEEQRISFLHTLATLPTPPSSVPVNVLARVEGTPLANEKEIDPLDYVRFVAAARVLMPKSYIRLTGGRHQLSPETHALCFFAGANSIHFATEKLLTTDNRGADDDMALFEKLGLKPLTLCDASTACSQAA